jgi:inner membrane transporter RhtA
MVSLLPATATVVGIVVLIQIPTARDLIGVALVVVAVATHRERPERQATDTQRNKQPRQHATAPPHAGTAGRR